MPEPVVVQETVRAYVGSLGPAGHAWLSALPGTVEEVCRDWHLERGAALPGGSRSFVCRVTTAGGGPAVLKVALPDAVFAAQLATLVAAQGQGYVQVLAHDLARGALLMEALGPPPDGETGDVPTVLTLVAQTLTRAWTVPVTTLGVAPAPDETKAATLITLIRECSPYVDAAAHRDVIDHALACARSRLAAYDPARLVVVHGDPHPGNLLPVPATRPGAETGSVFTDPEGFLCEPEYDLGVAARGWNTHLLAAADPRGEVLGWCDLLARVTTTDARAVWEWAFLERVTTGLYLARHGLAHLGTPFLTVARQVG